MKDFNIPQKVKNIIETFQKSSQLLGTRFKPVIFIKVFKEFLKKTHGKKIICRQSSFLDG